MKSHLDKESIKSLEKFHKEQAEELMFGKTIMDRAGEYLVNIHKINIKIQSLIDTKLSEEGVSPISAMSIAKFLEEQKPFDYDNLSIEDLEDYLNSIEK